MQTQSLSLEGSCCHLAGLVLTGHQPPHRQDGSHPEHCPPKPRGQGDQLLSAKATRKLAETTQADGSWSPLPELLSGRPGAEEGEGKIHLVRQCGEGSHLHPRGESPLG